MSGCAGRHENFFANMFYVSENDIPMVSRNYVDWKSFLEKKIL